MRDADNVWTCQGVTQQSLEYDPGKPKGHAGENGKDGAWQADVQNDEIHAFVDRTGERGEQRLDHVDWCDRIIAEIERQGEGNGQQDQEPNRYHAATGAEAVADFCHCAEGVDGGHSEASLRRRTRAMKKGAPSSAVTIPTCTSPGGETIRPMTSAPSSRIGASSME